MPWEIKKQKCKQADGKSGNYIVKKTSGKSSRKPSCHKTRMKAVGSKLAREKNESVLPIFTKWCESLLVEKDEETRSHARTQLANNGWSHSRSEGVDSYRKGDK